MKDDPIVAEVRKAREEIWRECDYDLDRFIERMKALEAQHPERMITREQFLAERTAKKSDTNPR